MTRRLFAILALAIPGAIALATAPSHNGAQASVSRQAAGSPSATATAAAVATLTATATTAATGTVTATATTTATVLAATAVATATATGTAVATATTLPLAAYPAPLTSASVARSGSQLVFRWSVASRRGLKGFNLYAGTHRLNAHLIPTHAKPTYRAVVPYRAGHDSLRVIFRNGQYFTVRP